MKLTAQDLQIGDWVLYENEPNIIAEVSEIVQGEAEVCFAVTNYMANIDEIKPMPLTPEILKKNGFRVVSEDELHVCYFQDIGRFHVEIKVDKVGIFQKLSMCDGFGNNVTIIECKFVHQLQQAMRLCKIRKEIEL